MVFIINRVCDATMASANFFHLCCVCVTYSYPYGPSIKDVGNFLAVFDTPLPHVGILTLIYLTSTSNTRVEF